jgi:hypothetical protein
VGTHIDIFNPGVQSQDEARGGGASIKSVNGHAGNGNGQLVNGNGAGPIVSSLEKGPLEKVPYQASGGDSERRLYEGGEGIIIESQDNGYVLAWSAEAQAPAFLRAVSKLVNGSAKVKIEDRRRTKSLAKALRVVTDHPETDVIEVDADDETFRWTMYDPYADERRDLARVTLAFSVLDPERVQGLIAETGAPHIKGDLADIVASIGHLTHTHLTTSSAAA